MKDIFGEPTRNIVGQFSDFQAAKRMGFLCPLAPTKVVVTRSVIRFCGQGLKIFGKPNDETCRNNIIIPLYIIRREKLFPLHYFSLQTRYIHPIGIS